MPAKIFMKTGGQSLFVGPTLQSVLAKNSWMKALLSPQEMKGAIQYAGKVAGERFATVFLPLRFDEEYAKRLGYRVAYWYKKWKVDNQGRQVVFDGKYGTLAGRATMVASPQPTPFRLSGSSEHAVLTRYRVIATSVRGELKIRITFPLGYIAYNKAKEFTTLLPHEYARTVQEVDRVLRTTLTGQLEDKGYIDPRILGTKSRGELDPAIRPSFIPERKAI